MDAPSASGSWNCPPAISPVLPTLPPRPAMRASRLYGEAPVAPRLRRLVADQLAISEDTVKGHVKSILSKLGVNDRTHAVTAALKRGIIEL